MPAGPCCTDANHKYRGETGATFISRRAPLSTFALHQSSVPKLLHQSWKTNELPLKFEKWSTVCREKHRDWEWVLWTNEDNLNLVKKYFPWLEETYLELLGEIYRADFSRNLYMYMFGGVYIDLNTDCLRPTSAAFEAFDIPNAENTTAGAEGEQINQFAIFRRMGTDESFENSIPNAWMASSPGHHEHGSKGLNRSSIVNKETILFTRFEKVLKEHLQEGPRDSTLLLDLERMLMRMERGKQKPLKFKDAVGRKFSFPFHLARTWKGMEDIIKQAFLDVDVIGPHVIERRYDLIGPSGEIILPQAWEDIVEPDMAITMHMWPMPEPEPEPPKNSSDDDDDDGDDDGDGDDQSSRSASPTLVDQDGPSPLESKSKKGRHWRIFKRWSNSASKEK
ncbi:hypothetical protein V499_02537 [Pseudogymnoascus sp. VKM F-103]|nr:hypothetical protein V499_02537 [Pseudogymnoascus sp. VKM F-103]